MSEINSTQVPSVAEVVPPVAKVSMEGQIADQMASSPVIAKKGKNTALIVVALGSIVVLLAIVVVVVLVLVNGNSSSGVTFKPFDKSVLGKVEGSGYTFYYPKAYAKMDVTTEDQILESYESKTKNTLEGYNSINLVSSVDDTKVEKQSDCKVLGTSLISFYVSEFGVEKEDVTNLAADLFTRDGMVGCDLRYKINVLSVNLYIDQVLFTKSNSNTMYIVSASNDKGTGAEYNELRGAVESFIIK